MPSSNHVCTGSESNSGPDSDLRTESFAQFFETWLLEQEHDLEELKAAATCYTESTQSDTEWNQQLTSLVNRVMCHYENYYRVKSESADHDVLTMLSPSWRSNLEEAFLWVGGWRPSTAFHLLYSVTGLQLEAGFHELLRGLGSGNLADLSPDQLVRVDELQRQTVWEERELTENFAAIQETVADSTMVELSHVATELIRDPNSVTTGPVGPESVNERVESTIGTKENKLKEILGRADDLRLRTLKNVLDILTPIQAVDFLIAAAELHLRVHQWGVKKDEGANNQQQQH